MKLAAHGAVGAGLATLLVALARPPLPAVLLALVAGAGFALLPDVLDFRLALRHRNRLTHGLPSLALPAGVTVLVACTWPGPGALALGVGACAGWGSHLLLDVLTPTGLPVRHGNHDRLSLRAVRYDSLAGNGAFVLAGVALLALAFWILA